ncbi:MAG: hypothetical protein Q9162_001714 [Coniocarpon cinnabarinum]
MALSPRLSMQSQRTNSTVVTQIYDPQASETPAPHSHDDYEITSEGSQSGQAQHGWEFLPPRSTRSPSSPSTPNFSRPFGARAIDGQPQLGTQSEEPYLEDHPEQEDYFGQRTNNSSSEQSQRISESSTPSAQSGQQRPKSNRKARYSSRSLYSHSGSEVSSRPRTGTEASTESADAPLIPEQQNALAFRPKPTAGSAPAPTSTPAAAQPTMPPAKQASEQPLVPPKASPPRSYPRSNSENVVGASIIRPSSQPYRDSQSRPQLNQRAPRPVSTSTLDYATPRSSIPHEPTLDLDALDETDSLSDLPVIAERPASITSAAEPPPMIRDGRMLDGRGHLLSRSSSSNSNGSGGKGTIRTNPDHRTQMTAWPEVQRPTKDRPEMPGRRWSASSQDTSGLSAEKIAKLKKKGINPALWLEMKQAQKKKGRFGLPPLVGNTFLGA